MARIGLMAVAAVAVANLLPGPEAQGQYLPGRGWGSGLTKEDIDRQNDAVAKLNLDVPVGTVETWDNPSSGNSGNVRLMQIHQKDGMPCLRIRYNIKFKESTKPKLYLVDRCRLPNGEWKLN